MPLLLGFDGHGDLGNDVPLAAKSSNVLADENEKGQARAEAENDEGDREILQFEWGALTFWGVLHQTLAYVDSIVEEFLIRPRFHKSKHSSHCEQ